MEREYRVVACSECTWRDYYRTRRSYPPRCPSCGAGCEPHYFTMAAFALRVRNLLGHDLGERVAFGDPKAAFKSERDRRLQVRGKNLPQVMLQ